MAPGRNHLSIELNGKLKFLPVSNKNSSQTGMPANYFSFTFQVQDTGAGTSSASV